MSVESVANAGDVEGAEGAAAAEAAEGGSGGVGGARPGRVSRRWHGLAVALALVLVPVASLAGAAAPELSIPSVAEMVALRTIEEQRLSPDGRQVAFVERPIASAGGQRPRHIWLVDSDGRSPPRKITGRFALNVEPRWSTLPTGDAKLAFFADRDTEATNTKSSRQLWLFTPATNDLRRVADHLSGASQLEWVPGTRSVSFVRRSEIQGSNPKAPQVLGTTPPAARLWLMDTVDGTTRAVSPESLSIAKYAWSADGASVAVTATASTEPDAPESVLLLSREGGAPRPLMVTHDETLSLAWSPDGKAVAWLGREHEPGSGQIMVMKTTGDPQPRTLLADFPGSALWLGYRPDGRLVMAALRGVRIGVYSFRADGSGLRTDYDPNALQPGTLCGEELSRFRLSFNRDGSRLSATVSGPHEPGNILVGQWKKPLKRVTDLNPQVRGWTLGDLETIHWQGRDGLALEGLLLKPPGWRAGQRYPTLVNVHGGPRRSWFASWLFNASAWGQYFASRGYLVFLPNPRGSEGYGAAFVRANTRDLGGEDWEDVMAGVDALVSRGLADSQQLALAGWSYGGFLTATGITRTERFNAAIIGAGVSNLVSFEGAGDSFPRWSRDFWRDALTPYRTPQVLIDRSPVHGAIRVRTPTLLFHGTADEKVPPAQTFELYTALRALGVPTEAVMYPGAGHGLTDAAYVQDVYARMDAWLQRYLPVRPAQVSHTTSAGVAGLTAERLATLEKLIAETMRADDVPGLTVAVALNGQLRWTAGYGTADLENSVPATATTRIRTASITKWMTATAAMRLVEEGKLDLEAPPQRYCKAYPQKQWPMVVRQLLNHTAGVRHYYGRNDEPRDTESSRQALAERQRQERLGQYVRYTDRTAPLDAFKDDPLVFEPGSRYRYTSHGYRLLGCVLEGASGESYSTLLERTVFRPAGMVDTTEDDAWAIIPHRAAGYAKDREGHLRRANFRDISENLPAGGHLSTAQDLVSFALAFNGGKLVQRETIGRMVERPTLPGHPDPGRYYGFGIQVKILPQSQTRLLTHGGAQSGTSTCLESLPEAGFAVAVMMNKEDASASELCDDIRDALIAHDLTRRAPER